MVLRSLMVSAVWSVMALPSLALAAPMPNSIVVQDKAVVPVLKTEVIRRIAGQEPVRQVTATVLEMTNQGKDIVAREIELQDHQAQFSEKQLSIPVLQKGGVIVPTSKIQVDKTLKQDGQVISQSKQINAEGVEFKKGQEPIKRTLKLDQAQSPNSGAKLSHAVLTENGEVSKDVTVLSDAE
ncbi:hypothetical protein [Acinetobacter sp. ANC 3813]|uniref:hypothetical protein n=1 Tax=Acinetobacter sp. ANC 3813 TaxID=1977873 RepID=UPI000A359423|nr:hypothetical protein [Acinetobacter sp. ANC 3813]OTG87281.1 hypothetical protein B9T34_17120 [Acinetobacter sp. ANC 3813]